MSHDHSHEHAHDHHHAKTLLDKKGCFLSMQEHEGSLVASYRLVIPESKDQAQKILTSFALSISREIDDAGGIVGHIKAFARCETTSFRISVTASDPDILEFDDAITRVEGVSIVFGVEKAWYEELMTEKIQALFSANSQ